MPLMSARVQILSSLCDVSFLLHAPTHMPPRPPPHTHTKFHAKPMQNESEIKAVAR